MADNPIFTLNQDIIEDIKMVLEIHTKKPGTPNYEYIIMNSIKKCLDNVGCKMIGIGEPVTNVVKCEIISAEEYLAKLALQDLIFHIVELRASNALYTFSAKDAIDRINDIVDSALSKETIKKLKSTIAAIDTLDTVGAIAMKNISPEAAEQYEEAMKSVQENLNTRLL